MRLLFSNDAYSAPMWLHRGPPHPYSDKQNETVSERWAPDKSARIQQCAYWSTDVQKFIKINSRWQRGNIVNNFCIFFPIKRVYLFGKYNQFYLHGELVHTAHDADWIVYIQCPFDVMCSNYNWVWVTCHIYLQFTEQHRSDEAKTGSRTAPQVVVTISGQTLYSKFSDELTWYRMARTGQYLRDQTCIDCSQRSQRLQTQTNQQQNKKKMSQI